MMKFKVGEILIVVKAIHPELEGLECEVINNNSRRHKNKYSIIVDGVDARKYYPISDVPNFYAFESQLKRKRKPQETTTWEAIEELTNWTPEGVSV